MTAGQGQFGGRKVREGTVVSDKMQKTVLVAVETNFRHRLYKKNVRRVRRLMVHDEGGDSQTGDRVRIVEANPISRHKRWRVVQVLSRAELPEVAPESIDLDLLGELKGEDVKDDGVEAPAMATTAAAVVVEAEAVSSPEAGAVVPEEVEVEEASSGDVQVVEASVVEDAAEPEVTEEPIVEAVGANEVVEAAAPADEVDPSVAEATPEEDSQPSTTDAGETPVESGPAAEAEDEVEAEETSVEIEPAVDGEERAEETPVEVEAEEKPA